MAELKDINGALTLREAWPIIEANEQALNVELADHQVQITDTNDRVDTIIQGGGPDKDAELVDIRTPDTAYTPLGTIAVAGDMTRDMQQQFMSHKAEFTQLETDYTNNKSTIRCGFVPNFIKKCLNGEVNGAWLGDSITVGGGTTVPTTDGFAYLTTSKLQTKYGSGVVMDNHGHGGYDVSELLEVVPTDITPNNYDLVVVEAGTNDWNYSTSLVQFEIDYRLLIETLLTVTKADIICIGLGWFDDWVSPTENPISETEYNDIIIKICAEYSIGYIDVRDAMINSGYAFDEITYTPDRVHPNDLGATIWSNEVFTWFDHQGYMNKNDGNHYAFDHRNVFDPNITYTGTWTVVGPFASTFDQHTKSSSGAGNKATFTYTGKKLNVYFVKDVDRGNAKITLDGIVLYSSYDLYSPAFSFDPLVIDSEYGEHTLEIEVLGTKNASSSGTSCSLVRFDNVIDLSSKREYDEQSAIKPEYMEASAGRSIDTNASYYFGKSIAATSSISVVGTVSAYAYGSKFKLLYTKFASYGNLDIYVDGELYDTIDAYAASATYKNIYEITGLTLGKHLIEIKTNGTKNTSSTGYGINIEGVLCNNIVKIFRGSGTHNVAVAYQFYENPNVQVTPTSNCTAYISAKTEKSVTVQTNPVDGTFDLRAEGY